jgi:hypothetical protein
MTVDKSPCPHCDAAPGCLSIKVELVNGAYRPVLRCTSCDLAVAGHYEVQNAVFRTVVSPTCQEAQHAKKV